MIVQLSLKVSKATIDMVPISHLELQIPQKTQIVLQEVQDNIGKHCGNDIFVY